MATSSTGRVLVYLRATPKEVPAIAKFTQSVVSSLADAINNEKGREKDEILVNCHLDQNRVVLSKAAGLEPLAAPLRRPPECPIKHLSESDVAKIPEDVLARGVAVGVVILLESSDAHVLVTRRAKHMRTFPGVWVPPGGSVEAGETLLETGLRELEEETGIAVPASDESGSSGRVLCLWESVYPPFLERGLPKRHHVVVYFLVRANDDHETLDEKIVLEPEEVDASAWLSKENVDFVVHGEEAPSGERRKETFKMKLLLEDGEVVSMDCPSEVLTAKAPVKGVDVERFSSGTIFALSEWLKASF